MCDCAPLVAALRRSRVQTDRGRWLAVKLLDSDVCIEHHEGLSDRADFGSRLYAPEPATERWMPARTTIYTIHAMEFSDTSCADWTTRLESAQWKAACTAGPTTYEIVETIESDQTGMAPWSAQYELSSEGLLYLRPRRDDEQRRL